MTVPEAPIWDLLDHLGLPFRETAGALIARFGTRPCLWSEGHRECVVSASPLLPGLSAFSFNVLPGDDPSLPPDWFSASYRGSVFRLTDHLRDHRAARNFAHLAGAIAARLGSGHEVSSSNTLTQEWRFGLARLRVTAFPPHLNARFGPNSRHEHDPDSEHEASLTLNPGYLPPLGDQALGWLSGFRALDQSTPFNLPRWNAAPRWHRWPVQLGPEPSPGFGLSQDGTGFVVVSNGFVKTLPRAGLISLERVLLTPAKGPGGASLDLLHAPAGLGARPHRLTLLVAEPTPDALRAEAQRLAAALNLPLQDIEEPDC